MCLTIGNHGQKSAAGMVILGVSLEMLRKLLNALSKYGNLHLRRACVLIVDGYFLDELFFLGF